MVSGKSDESHREGSVFPLHPTRRRSEGVLDPAELKACREKGIPLAFDPVQIGWIRMDCEDDMRWNGPLSWRLSSARSDAYHFRKWTERDSPTLARILSSRRLWEYLPEDYGGPMTPDTARELIALSNGTDHHVVRAVEFKGKVIGQVRIEFRKTERETAEISYWLADSVWGQGHGSVIVARFSAECLHDHPSVTRLLARVHPENRASARVLTKAGYKLFGDATDELWQTFVRDRAEAGSPGRRTPNDPKPGHGLSERATRST
ncbi:MAG: acetyltransferase [Rhodobacteraceae bacterium HLUCCO07]|nr:MAG: acetyltransferase [Rhodobacteraceae bacterium HLUCCO07]